MKLFSRSGLLFLIAFTILGNSQIFASLINSNQEAESVTELSQCEDSTQRFTEFIKSPFYIGLRPLLVQINSFLKIKNY